MATNKKYELKSNYTFKLGKRQVFNTKQKNILAKPVFNFKDTNKMPSPQQTNRYF